MKFTIDGQTAYAYTGGREFDPQRPCIIFLHGALHDHSVWTLTARWFAHHGYSVLAVDQPGHMRSLGAPLESVEAIGQWLIKLMDAAQVSQATLVGHSMGSLIALETAAQAPERVKRLVMVGTAFPMAVAPAVLQGALTEIDETMAMINAYSISTWSAKPSYPGPGAWLHGGNLALMRRVLASNPGTNLFHHDFRLCNEYARAMEAAQSVVAPAHLILGERDQMTPPKAAKALAQALKASVHTLPCGHGVMNEDPEGFLRVMRQLTAPAAG